MPLSFFEILRPVIDSEVQHQASASGVPIEDIYYQIVQEAERNQQEWYSNRVPNLNYRLPECRLAYLYIVAAANACTFFHVLENSKELRKKIFDLAITNQEMKLCAFSAGPGTELLGMAKCLEGLNLGHSVSVEFQLLDLVQEWASSWYGIRDSVNDYFRNRYGTHRVHWPMNASGNLLQCDVCETSRLRFLGHIWNQDIYVINFLLSEIFEDDPGLRSFISAAAEKAPVGSMFVFIERRGYRWQERIVKIVADAGLSLSSFVESKQDSLQNENPTSLGNVYQHLRDIRRPRLGWNVVYSIGEKHLTPVS
jgi:hypothetical protein